MTMQSDQHVPHLSFDAKTWHDDREATLLNGKHKRIFFRWVVREVHLRVQAH